MMRRCLLLRLAIATALIECLLYATADEEEEYEIPAFARMPPVRQVMTRSSNNVVLDVNLMRGGASENLDATIAQLGIQYGSAFLNAIEQVSNVERWCCSCF